ncbi:hypothetical protein ABPG75_009497 [Micractinium tetrahymenae]
MKPGAAQGEVPAGHCCPTLVVAGTGSGVGKTSLTVGLCRALRQKGLIVQAFKCGPDFIDPMHHQEATGRPSINLDTWMLSQEQVLGAFHRAAAGADVAVVEGVMGLFDGRDGATEAGSTAQLAKWLGAPVLLVLDASAVARSAAAVAKGYIEFDAQLRLGALLFNRVGGAAHTQWLRDALTAAGIAAPVLGGVPKSDAVSVPERHLGLHLPADPTVPAGLADALADLVSTHVDLDALLELARTAEVPPAPAEALELPLPASAPAARPVRIAVAQDAAFCFYYHDNLALLRAAGADLVPFSPLADSLPADVAGVYLGGGYPERHAADLADNRVLRASLEAFARAGGVVYAECGGLIYLSKSLQPAPDEAAIPMVGVFPFRTVMGGPGGMRMGYVEVETRPGCPLFPEGATVRGQVFHFSEIVQESVVSGLGAALTGRSAAGQPWRTCYTVTPQIPGAAAVEEGYCLHNVLASYVHLHFGACPEFAAALVERCRGVDVAAVGAAAQEAAQAACYLESALGSLHTSPQLLGKGGHGVPHCRSSPDLAREGQLNGKHRAASLADPHRHFSDDGLLAARHASDAASHHHLLRHGGMLQPGAAANGMAGHPSLSPATTLSKVVSLNSLASCSPHVVGTLPPGDALSPPLSDSPQQLSPRELEAQQREAELQQQQHVQQQFFGGGKEGPPPVPPLPLGALLQQHPQQPQYHHQHHQQQYVQQQQGYGGHAHYAPPPQPQHAYQQPPYANGHPGGHVEQQQPQHSAFYASGGGLSRPPLGSSGSLGQLAAASSSWPRLHPHPQASGSLPPQPPAYGPVSARGGVSAFAMSQPPPHQQQQQQQQQQPQCAGGSGAAPYYAANGAAGGFFPATSRHSRNGSGCYERPGSAGPPAALAGRTPSPLDLAGMERLEQRPLSLTATPYNWQHSHAPSDKIVSLSPGATEMLWALGLGARVAAVTDACDFPPDVVARAKARRSFAAPTGRSASYASLERHPSGSSAGTSGAASRRESPTMAAGRSGAAAWAAAGAGSSSQLAQLVDEEVLARERPGLVVYEETPGESCGGGGPEGPPPGAAGAGAALCASGCGMGQAVLEALMAVGLQQSCRVVCVRRRTLADVLDSMLLVGEAAGVREEALCTVDRLRARLRRLAGEAAAAAALAPSRPRVLMLQSLRPLRTVGWWAPDQLTLAGGACGLEEAAGDAPQELNWEQVQAFAPEVLVVAGMAGGTALRPLTDLCAVAALPGWWLLPAVRASAVYIADAALFCRAGPRLVEGVECLARMLWGEDATPNCACPEGAALKLSLRPGQRCRPRLLPNHFVPFK